MAKTVEQGLREYLDSVQAKPTKQGRLVDKEVVKVLSDQIKSETDPLNKLKLMAQRDEARAGKEAASVDNSGLEVVFVQNAKEWAETNKVSVSNFLALKVPAEVLVKAGFSVPADAGKKSATSTRTRVALPMDDVKAALPNSGTFTIRQVADKLNRSTAVVAGKFKQLLDEGHLKDKGDDPNHDGRGRSPKLYARK